MSEQPLAIVAGSGPGLGLHLVKVLQARGYTAVGLNRSTIAGESAVLSCDLTEDERVKAAVNSLVSEHGVPRVVIHNPAKLVMSRFEDTSIAAFEATWRSMVLSAVNLGKAVLPMMADAGEGAFLVSGATASLRGGAGFGAFASAKAGLRALTQSLAKEYGPKGVHVGHVILDGILDTAASRDLHDMSPDRMLKLDDVAEAYLALANQPKSAWTFEMDLRPMGESF